MTKTNYGLYPRAGLDLQDVLLLDSRVSSFVDNLCVVFFYKFKQYLINRLSLTSNFDSNDVLIHNRIYMRMCMYLPHVNSLVITVS